MRIIRFFRSSKGAWLLFGLCLATILTASSIPSQHLNLPPVVGIDKLLHTAQYFVFSILFWRARALSPPPALLRPGVRTIIWWPLPVLTFMLLLFAWLDELHQGFIPGRHVSIYDALANSLGIFLGLAVFVLIGHTRQRNTRKQGEHHVV